MYPEYMQESIKKVEATRPDRLELARKLGKMIYPGMNKQEREEVLNENHPDYKAEARTKVRIGPDKGMVMTTEIAEMLERYSRIDIKNFDLSKADIKTDVLVIGAGSAGMSAAIVASEQGSEVLLATKLRLGDSNSMMAQGGIQAADQADDSPIIHYLDVMGGGHFDNKPDLVKALVNDAPLSIKWLEDMGVMFDKKESGQMVVQPGGGTSRNRMHSARDYTGAAICKVIRDEVYNRADKIKYIEYTAIVELLLNDKKEVSGAVMYHLENKQFSIVKAKSVIISTGGFGRLHIRGFETSNHYGATADGIAFAYRAGAHLLYMDSVQYHPTGAVYPEQIVGFLCTEKIRAIGAQPVNKDGELFVYPLEPRDVEASAFIRECNNGKGISTPSGIKGIWLDTPLIDQINGEGTIEKELPAMLRQYQRFGIDIREVPMLVYPTLHYQNGGIDINDRCETNVPGLYVAGEATGGVHGRNRLMGNSQLDIIVFGKRAGQYASERAKTIEDAGNLSLDHVLAYNKEVEALGIERSKVSPIILPDYIPDHVKAKQLIQEYNGTLI
ncbi:MAG: FAD-binding protein [Candidatus Delongbacteria bacterium]|nr:FAD-binding protein [Candidatus Delongbacteria bacterium]MCG2760822.1 FAD-binding protein [Candidatus Delongbacteria bacterium]